MCLYRRPTMVAALDQDGAEPLVGPRPEAEGGVQPVAAEPAEEHLVGVDGSPG